MSKLTNIQIAQLAHEINRAICISAGDNSQPVWDDAPEWQRTAAIAGIDYHSANVGVTPDMSHKAWLDVKLADGWVYGPVKNAEKKEHPCIVDYNELPYEQRVKDYVFQAIVETCNSL